MPLQMFQMCWYTVGERLRGYNRFIRIIYYRHRCSEWIYDQKFLIYDISLKRAFSIKHFGNYIFKKAHSFSFFSAFNSFFLSICMKAANLISLSYTYFKYPSLSNLSFRALLSMYSNLRFDTDSCESLKNILENFFLIFLSAVIDISK